MHTKSPQIARILSRFCFGCKPNAVAHSCTLCAITTPRRTCTHTCDRTRTADFSSNKSRSPLRPHDGWTSPAVNEMAGEQSRFMVRFLLSCPKISALLMCEYWSSPLLRVQRTGYSTVWRFWARSPALCSGLVCIVPQWNQDCSV
jgi:hypothetical protein